MNFVYIKYYIKYKPIDVSPLIEFNTASDYLDFLLLIYTLVSNFGLSTCIFTFWMFLSFCQDVISGSAWVAFFLYSLVLYINQFIKLKSKYNIYISNIYYYLGIKIFRSGLLGIFCCCPLLSLCKVLISLYTYTSKSVFHYQIYLLYVLHSKSDFCFTIKHQWCAI